MRFFQKREGHIRIYLSTVHTDINKSNFITLSTYDQTIELNLQGSVNYNQVGKYNQVIKKLEEVVLPEFNERLEGVNQDSDKTDVLVSILSEQNFIQIERVEVEVSENKYGYFDKIIGDEQIVGVFKGSDENLQLEFVCSVGRYTMNQIMQKMGYGRKHEWKSKGFWLKVLEG